MTPQPFLLPYAGRLLKTLGQRQNFVNWGLDFREENAFILKGE
jgi:hypothetical protein